MDVIWVFTSNY